MNYQDFIAGKLHCGADTGFEPLYIPDSLFDFQKHILSWSTRKGRSAIFADCGLGKTLIELAWAKNIFIKTNKPVLILTPLAVSQQTVLEGQKFGIECNRSIDGKPNGITVTNYEKLHLFSSSDFSGVACDESSILKSFDGARKQEITEFMRKVQYRSLYTATAAPNDYTELGTSSEALGYLGFMDMLNRFFKNDRGNSATKRMYGEAPEWRFKGHAEIPFWRWITSWAIACRKPSDLGYSDDNHKLTNLIIKEHMLDNVNPKEGMLFTLPAYTLPEQREEKKRTIKERCEKALELVNNNRCSVVWCHLNEEGDFLEKIIPDSVQVSGRDSDESKEKKFIAFSSGQIKTLITKPKIGAWGLNWQHCNHSVYFPSHSFEQFYQSVRRFWRFGQTSDVTIDIVMTEGENRIMDNLRHKSESAEKMFESLVSEMNNSISIKKEVRFNNEMEIPKWLTTK